MILNFQTKNINMKYLNKIMTLVFTLLLISCQAEDNVFGDINAPTNLQVDVEVVGQDISHPDGDGSGKVNFKAVAQNAISYKYVFNDGTTASSPNGVLQKQFTNVGVNTYTITVLANGKGGVSTSKTLSVTVRSDFEDDEAVGFLTGGSTKKWYWSASEPGHLGVGQNDGDATKNYYANYYQAAAFEKASTCLYNSELTFSLQAGVLKCVLDNQGQTYFNTAYNSVVGGTSTSDDCYPFTTSGTKTVTLGPSDSILATTNPDKTRKTMMTFSDNGFMGYYVGATKYEILSITANRLYVRCVMGNNPALAWYHIFTSTPPVPASENFTNLVWFDEFDVDGAPNSTKWDYDLGAGGWGNNEAQHYTNSSNNVSISGGKLKITAKKENFSGSAYTSARLKTQNKFDFKYGKLVVRAKLPEGGGTWPAIWMLGKNIGTVGWPDCGEIDVMEHVGNQQNHIFHTMHYPGHSGGGGVGNAGAFVNATASSQFHDYSVVWNANVMKFYVDNVLSYTFTNASNLPFNQNFFIILNVAMGGNFGGAIDPAFTQSSMEIDYVRVYQ